MVPINGKLGSQNHIESVATHSLTLLNTTRRLEDWKFLTNQTAKSIVKKQHPSGLEILWCKENLHVLPRATSCTIFLNKGMLLPRDFMIQVRSTA